MQKNDIFLGCPGKQLFQFFFEFFFFIYPFFNKITSLKYLAVTVLPFGMK